MLAILAILLVSMSAFGADYHIYCSSTNTGAGDGSLLSPYAALSSVKMTNIGAHVAAGDTVFVRLQMGSVFRAKWDITTNSFNVCPYDTISTNRPVIDCTDVLTGWGTNSSLACRGGVWTNAKASVDILFANGAYMQKIGSFDGTRLLNHQWFTTNSAVYLRWDEGNPDTVGVTVEGNVRTYSIYGEKSSSLNFTNIVFKHGSTYGVRIRNAGFNTFDRCLFTQGLELLDVESFSNLVVNACVFQDAYQESGQMVKIWGTDPSNLLFRYCLFNNSRGNCINGSVASLGDSLINCTFADVRGYFALMAAGTYLGITNCVFSGTSAGNLGSTSVGIKSSGTCYLDHSLTMYSAQSIGARLSGVVESNPIQGDPAYVSNRFPAYIVFERDDATSLPWITNDVRNMRAYGVSWPVCMNYPTKQNNPTIPVTDSNSLNWLVTNGCEVNAHGRWHSELMEPRAFHVKYVGASSVATLTIAASNLTTTLDGGTDLNLDLTSASYDTLGEVVAALNTGDYRCTNPATWGLASTVASWLLTNTSAANIKGVFWTNQVDWTNYLDQMLVKSKSDLEAVLTNSYSVKTWVNPGSSTDKSWTNFTSYPTAFSNMQSAGYTSCRGLATIPTGDYLLSSNSMYYMGNVDPPAEDVLNLQFDLQSGVDTSAKANTFIMVGNTYTNQNTGFGAYSCCLNGTTAHLHHPSDAEFTYTNGDWSITAFVYPSNLVDRQTIYFMGTDDTNHLWIYANADGSVTVDAGANNSTICHLSTPAGALTNAQWGWVWVQQAFNEWDIRVNCLLKNSTNVAGRLVYFASTTNYIGCRYGFVTASRTNYFAGMLDEFEIHVNPLAYTYALADDMREQGGVGIIFMHNSGPGRHMTTVDGLARWTGNAQVVRQRDFADICINNGAISDNDGYSRLRTNALAANFDYRIKPTSGLRLSGDVSAIFGITNGYDLRGNPITGPNGESLRSRITVGCYEYETPRGAFF